MPTRSIFWEKSDKPVAYPQAVSAMESHVAAMLAGSAGEKAWLLEHPSLYTAGTSAKPDDLLDNSLPVFQSGRGGQFTYHGPGQRIVYLMLDLKRRAAPDAPDLRAYVKKLEAWLIATLGDFGLEAFTREGRIGVWVHTPGGEAKIAALGIRVKSWVTYHGVALNVAPDLSHYRGIVPCGIRQFGVTSLADLGIGTSITDVDAALKRQFAKYFP